MPIDNITHRIRTGLNNVYNRSMIGIDLLTILMINLVLVHGPRSLSIVLIIMVLLTPTQSSSHAELTRPCNECSIQTHTIINLISISPILKAIGTIFLLLLLLSGDVVLNPGPNDLNWQFFRNFLRLFRKIPWKMYHTSAYECAKPK